MNKMIYRWMRLPQQPQFSFTEKLFLSGRSHHRMLGHIILMARAFGNAIKVPVLLGAIIIATFSVVGVLVYGLDKLVYLIADKYHISLLVATAIIFSPAIVMLLIIRFIKFIKDQTNKNSIFMKEVLENRLNANTKPQK